MFAVTGATGKLGRLVVKQLVKRVAAEQIVAAVRRPSAAQDLAALGVHVRHADCEKPESLTAALKGVDKLLLISGSEPGKRVPQHRAVIEAAKRTNVSTLTYTSSRGALNDNTHALSKLLGRPTTPLAAALRALRD